MLGNRSDGDSSCLPGPQGRGPCNHMSQRNHCIRLLGLGGWKSPLGFCVLFWYYYVGTPRSYVTFQVSGPNEITNMCGECEVTALVPILALLLLPRVCLDTFLKCPAPGFSLLQSVDGERIKWNKLRRAPGTQWVTEKCERAHACLRDIEDSRDLAMDELPPFPCPGPSQHTVCPSPLNLCFYHFVISNPKKKLQP